MMTEPCGSLVVTVPAESRSVAFGGGPLRGMRRAGQASGSPDVSLTTGTHWNEHPPPPPTLTPFRAEGRDKNCIALSE